MSGSDGHPALGVMSAPRMDATVSARRAGDRTQLGRRAVARVGVVVALMLSVLVGTIGPALAETLRPGSSGPAVTCWQKKLRWVALARPTTRVPLITADGRYGTGTSTATKVFQRARGLAQDGVAGTRTQASMQSYLLAAARNNADEYASALYNGRCGTVEPMVCRRVVPKPFIRQHPDDPATGVMQYFGAASCTKLDAALVDQDAYLYLIEVGRPGTDARTLTSASHLRTTNVSLSKSVRGPAATFRPVFGVKLHGGSMFVSVPGCRRVDSRLITCEWAGPAYENG